MMQKLSDVIENARRIGQGGPVSQKKYLVESPFMDGSELRFLTRSGAELCPIEAALLEVGFCKNSRQLELTVADGTENFYKASEIFQVPTRILKKAMNLADQPNAVDGVAYLRSKGY